MPSPFPPLNDPDWLRTEYLERGRTQDDIAAEVGCSQGAVTNALDRHGIRRPPQRRLADVPADWLNEQYQARGRSIVDIARELHLSPTSVRRALDDAGIPVDSHRAPAALNDSEWLAAQEGRTNADVARELGVSPKAVSTARARHGLRRRKGTVKYPQLDDPGWLAEQYLERGRPQQEIAEEVGCARNAVTVALRRHGIPARPTKVVQYPQLRDRAWLARRLADGATIADIASELGCHPTTVGDALRREGLRRYGQKTLSFADVSGQSEPCSPQD